MKLACFHNKAESMSPAMMLITNCGSQRLFQYGAFWLRTVVLPVVAAGQALAPAHDRSTTRQALTHVPVHPFRFEAADAQR